MPLRKRNLLGISLSAIIFLSLLIGGCTPASLPASAVPTSSPAVPFTPVPTVLAPVVETETPVTPTGSASSTSIPLQPTGTSPQMPKTLQEMGYSVATLTDPTGGLAFDYPANWNVVQLSAEQEQSAMVYTIGLRSMSVTPTPKQQEGLPEGMTAIDFTISKESQSPKTLTQAINERRAAIVQPESGQPARILSEEDWLLKGGLPAHRFLIDIGPAVNGGPGPNRVMSELVTVIKGQMVLVDGQGDQSLFEAIAASLREIP